MSCKVLVVGFDALDCDIVDRLAAEGHLPTFAELSRSSTTLAMASCLDDLPGAIWPELTTGVPGHRSGLFFHPEQFRGAEGRNRAVTADEIDGEAQFWVAAARAGARTLAVDMPQSMLVADLPSAVQVIELSAHDRLFEPASEPRDILGDIPGFGTVFDGRHCDSIHTGEPAQLLELRDVLRGRIDTKARWVSRRLATGEWDLATVVFAESHCIGHHAIHLHLPDHPWRPATVDPAIGDPLRDVYGHLDDALARLLDAAGDNSQVIVVASHGMDRYVGGYQLIPELLSRMGLASGSDRLAARPTDWPAPVRRAARAFVPVPLRRWRRRRAGHLAEPFSTPDTRVGYVANNRRGAVRVNLRGRDPYGSVDPDEFEPVLADVATALTELRDPDTGAPVVQWARRTDEMFGPERHPDLPDLIVAFEPELGPIERAVSPRFGLLHVPVARTVTSRTGDHDDCARWWVRGPRLDMGGETRTRAIDLAPTVLAALGRAAPGLSPGRVVGRPVPGPTW